MNDEDNKLKWLQDKYRRLYKNPNFAGSGGFFRTSKRKQLLGLKGKSGRDSTKADFRYKIREQVKTALIDFLLFIETAEKKDVDSVINRESLFDLVTTLINPDKPNSTKAKIAQLFAEYGLKYLSKSQYITQNQVRIIDDAIETSNQLTLLSLSEKEKESYNWRGVPRA